MHIYAHTFRAFRVLLPLPPRDRIRKIAIHWLYVMALGAPCIKDDNRIDLLFDFAGSLKTKLSPLR